MIGSEARTVAERLLQGAVDLHMHTAPDIYPRSVTTLEAALQAQAAGMRAIVVKSHSSCTAARAELVSAVTGFPVFGGVTLNYSVGGFNRHAVVEAARQGGRIVWLPTTSARHFLRGADNVPTLGSGIPENVDGLAAVENGELADGVDDVLRAVAKHDLILASGHLHPAETIAVFERARMVGVSRLVVTHPHAKFVGATIPQMEAMAELGAKHEMHYAFTTSAVEPPQSVDTLARIIRDVGIRNCLLATDGGQSINPPPVEMMTCWLGALLEWGFDEAELRSMIVDTPLALLGDALPAPL